MNKAYAFEFRVFFLVMKEVADQEFTSRVIRPKFEQLWKENEDPGLEVVKVVQLPLTWSRIVQRWSPSHLSW